MSRVAQDQTSSRAARDANKRGKKAEHATCDRPPLDPDNLHGDYDTVEGERHNRWVLKVRWDEVVEDTFGQAIKLRRYNLEWQHSKDGGVTWGDSGRARVPAKNDDDANDKYHYIIRKIKPRFDYRYHVAAEAKDGCRSVWSGWFDAGQAEESPPAPTNVTLDIDEGTAHATWVIPSNAEQPPQDATHTDIKDLKFDHAECQLFRGSIGSGNLEHEDNFTHAEKWQCKLKTPPEDTSFIFRVRSVSEGGTTSVWVQTTATKNRPSQPGAPTIAFDAAGPRHSRFRAIVTVQEVADTDYEIDHYRVQFVTKFNAGVPDNTDTRHNQDVSAKGTNKELTAVFKGVRADQFTHARTRATDKNNKLSDWSNWTSGGKPSAVDAIPALLSLNYITARRRVGISWLAPLVGNIPDERIARVEVQIATDNGFTALRLDVHKHAGHGQVRYAIPLADVGTTFYVRIRPLDEAGNLGAWQPSIVGHALNGEPDATSVLEPGTIFHHATPAPNVWGPAHGALYCNGGSYLVADYPALFAEILYTYGGSGANFNVPDSQGRHLIGVGSNGSLGASDGLAENLRVTTHEPHGIHGDHGTHGDHGDHGDHGSHRNDNKNGDNHTHASGALSSSESGATVNAGTQAGSNASGAHHTHNITGSTSGGESTHTHNHGAAENSLRLHHDVIWNGAVGIGHGAHAGHVGHFDHGLHDYQPFVQGHGPHSGHPKLHMHIFIKA